MNLPLETPADLTERPLRVTRTGNRMTVTLHRPNRHNALDGAMVEALHEALDGINPADIKMLVLQGSGPSFCSGFDLTDIEAETDGSLLLRFVRIEQLLQRIFRAPYHTIALAHGRAFGAGADLFCACQHRLAAPDTTFRFPGTSFGLALGSGRLAARVGIDGALALLRSTRSIDAIQAKARGLLTEIVAIEERAAYLDQLAREQAQIEPDTLKFVVELMLPATDQNDLAILVRSAARPGLKSRIMDYAARRDRQR
jgi:enoyl-CoA hydratase